MVEASSKPAGVAHRKTEGMHHVNPSCVNLRHRITLLRYCQHAQTKASAGGSSRCRNRRGRNVLPDARAAVVGRVEVEVEDDLRRRRVVRIEKDIDEHRLDQRRVIADLVIARAPPGSAPAG